MRYTICITRNNIPTDDKLAWQEMQRLYKVETCECAPDFVELINKLEERYPCYFDSEESELNNDCVWTDSPLIESAGKDITVLSIRISKAEQVVPFLIETANSLNFVFFDSQSARIIRPKTDDFVQEDSRPTKGFWNRLLKR